jgi:alpha-beta hydrolase superfamily lysophospholipase
MVPGCNSQCHGHHPARERVLLLLIHGAAERIMLASGRVAFFETVKLEDRVLKLCEGEYHQTAADRNRRQVPADVAAWLDPRA